MKTLIILIIQVYLGLLINQAAFAGAAVEAQQRALLQRRAYEQAIKQKIYQDAVIQRQAQQQAAYQQAIRQKVSQQQASAYQQARAQQQQLNAYRQAMAQHKAVIQQQQLAAHQQRQAYQQVAGAQVAQQKMAYEQAANLNAARQKAAYGQMAAAGAALNNQSFSQDVYSTQNNFDQPAANQFDMRAAGYQDYSEPDEIVDIQDLWKDLENSSEAWPMMMDMAPKVATIEKYKDYYKLQGIGISKSPETYIELIDSLIIQNPGFLQNKFSDLFRLAAVMEYDFDNGVDKDELARRVLGNEIYEQNRKRMGK